MSTNYGVTPFDPNQYLICDKVAAEREATEQLQIFNNTCHPNIYAETAAASALLQYGLILKGFNPQRHPNWAMDVFHDENLSAPYQNCRVKISQVLQRMHRSKTVDLRNAIANCNNEISALAKSFDRKPHARNDLSDFVPQAVPFSERREISTIDLIKAKIVDYKIDSSDEKLEAAAEFICSQILEEANRKRLVPLDLKESMTSLSDLTEYKTLRLLAKGCTLSKNPMDFEQNYEQLLLQATNTLQKLYHNS